MYTNNQEAGPRHLSLTATSCNFSSSAVIAEPSSPSFCHLLLSLSSPALSLSLSSAFSLHLPSAVAGYPGTCPREFGQDYVQHRID